MTLDKLQPGMLVYDVHSYRMGYTTLRSIGVWKVHILAVDRESRTVQAMWNGNKSQLFRERQWSKWRLKAPELEQRGMRTVIKRKPKQLTVPSGTTP
jgi:hypothetical protein